MSSVSVNRTQRQVIQPQNQQQSVHTQQFDGYLNVNLDQPIIYNVANRIQSATLSLSRTTMYLLGKLSK